MRRRSRGQVLVIFALTSVVFIGLCAVVVDVAWYWANSLRMQRAADAAALAGVVRLPQDEPGAIVLANNEAAKNGYVNGTAGVVVFAEQDNSNPRRMYVQISGPVNTYFARLFGITAFPATRQAKAEFVLPVPMGSPEAYYGTFGELRTPDGGTYAYTPHSATTSALAPNATASPSNWTNPGNAYTSNNQWATKNSTTNPLQGFRGFSIPGLPGGATIDGITVNVEGRASVADCVLRAALSSNASAGTPTWTTAVRTISPPLSFTSPATDGISTVGDPTDLWGRTWTVANLANLGVRLEYRTGSGGICPDGSTVSVDQVSVEISYSWTSSVFTPDCVLRGPGTDLTNPCDPTGPAVNARGFWGTMHSPGSNDVDGDAYLPRFEQGSGTTNDQYDPVHYYDYAVEIPAGVSGGEVWVFDPVFCATDGSGEYGTGDRWFSGSSATSAFFDLFDTRGTPYDLTDDPNVNTISGVTGGSSGGLFQGIRASDATLDGPTGGGIVSCAAGATSNQSDGRYWHNKWWRLASGLPGGRTYRLRTASTDPANNSASGHNSFAIYARGSGSGAIKVHGIGAMEAFTPLNGGQASTFYLAQIEAIHAGKTVEIRLWDPGDTGNLTADLRILVPGDDGDGTTPLRGDGYTAVRMDYTSDWGTINSNRANCDNLAGNGVTSIRTNNGGAKVFNGCWLTINIQIPLAYTAPDPLGVGPGWWRIEYDMQGSSSDNSFDLTTWQVQIRGNPVHLIVP